ncbi:MAG TPA: hypothetical protein EYQ20_06955 [candidate division Zixibacteria bacterium]|nr:hypothetical protein [candidate division Zixibacteria bacterium]
MFRFKTRFPLVKGFAYPAEFDLDILFALIEMTPTATHGNPLATCALPKSEELATTVVVNVYPTVDRLPENRIKFYIHFSGPMERGHANQFIRLMDDAEGRPVEAPFLEPAHELWDSKTQRLTMLFDPDRMKRGPRLHEDLGLAFQEGRPCRLVVAEDMLDASGQTP